MQSNKIYRKLLMSLMVIILATASCSNKKEEQKKLQEEVISTHDILMGKMSDLMENKRKLTQIELKLDSFKKIDLSLDTLAIRIKIENTKKDLVAADDEMMDWMNNFTVTCLAEALVASLLVNK